MRNRLGGKNASLTTYSSADRLWANTTTNSFAVKTGDIPPMMRTQDLDKLMKKPSHKITRLKFNKQKIECLNERENDPLTMEDHFKLMDMPWIQALRFVEPMSPQAGARKTFEGDNPPPFFQQDMDKWSQKFLKANEERSRYKKLMGKMQQFNYSTKNLNSHNFP